MIEPEAAGQSVNVWAGLKDIYVYMSPSRRRQFWLVLALMIAGAIAELATIGAILPFLELLANSTRPSPGPWLQPIYSRLWAGDPLLVAATIFMLMATIAGLTRLQLVRSARNF